MSKGNKYGQLGIAVRILWLVLWGSVLLTGCISRPPKNIEVIVSARDKPTSFQLSPDGKRMTYQLYPHKRLVMDFTTSESIEIPSSCWTWLTGTKLKCGLEYVLEVTDLSRIPLSQISAEEVRLLLLDGDYVAYWDSSTGAIVLLPSAATESGYYYRLESGAEDTDSLPLLEGYPYTTINLELPMGQGVSPDGRYYYDYGMTGLHIHLRLHSIADDRVVAEYKMDSSAHRIRLGGWVYDSSGVIFQEYAFGYGYGTGVYPIAKLKVPDEP